MSEVWGHLGGGVEVPEDFVAPPASDELNQGIGNLAGEVCRGFSGTERGGGYGNLRMARKSMDSKEMGDGAGGDLSVSRTNTVREK